MFDWIISGADRWAVLSGQLGGANDGMRMLIAQRGRDVIILEDTSQRLLVATTETEDESVSNFYGSLSHFQHDHELTVEAQWTDAEVNAL